MTALDLANPAAPMLTPALALAGLIFAVYVLMPIVATFAKTKGLVSDAYLKTRVGQAPPDWVITPARNWSNLFEAPVLFFVIVAFHLAAPAPPDGLQIGLAWAFVALRVAHTLVHVTINQVLVRFGLHVSGVAVLAVLWVRFGLAVV